ncbi:MAG TPA: zinc-ribbon domain-containing protein [Planctomycetaceae bacterium]|nr:zinc-ribbon domain-containing protein [Planctomycetaceae bacterium]
MPVKVRCPNCEKLLNAPDAARGKSIKCPGCETKIRVPAGEEGSSAGRSVAAKSGAKRKVGQDSMEILANLDLSSAADSSANMCPKCGADIPEEATECPKCGVDPTTGQVSEAAKRRLSRKGPDPALFYSAAWTDGWAFTKANMRIVLRTTWYAIFWYGVASGCFFMFIWSSRLPPKAFWLALTAVSMLVFPGWLWFLRLETIRVTTMRKSNISDRDFDVFQSISLALTEIVWRLIFGWMPGTMVMYPLAMIHLAMPVTRRGWRWPSMLMTFFRNIGPTLYYWLMEFILNLPVNGTILLVAILSGHQLEAIVNAVKAGEKAPIRWPIVVGAVVCAIFGLFWFTFSSIYLMRVIGLLAYYYRDTLDLVTRVAEKEYVRREIKLDAFGNPIMSRSQKATQWLIPIVAFIVIILVGYSIYYQIYGKSG